jgi:proteasome lid subunit RPN8/RPN11
MKVPQKIYDSIVDAAVQADPLEACGLLGGDGDSVKEFYQLSNTDASSDHYNMSPGEQFAAIKDMREKGISMIGIWHSHPETPARMSEEDKRLAMTPGVTYVILSLAGSEPVVKGFRLLDDDEWHDVGLTVISG